MKLKVVNKRKKSIAKVDLPIKINRIKGGIPEPENQNNMDLEDKISCVAFSNSLIITHSTPKLPPNIGNQT